MSTRVTLDSLRRAWEARDPELCKSIIAVIGSDDVVEYQDDTALDKYFETIGSYEFTELSDIDKARYRSQQFKLIEADEKSVPDRFRVYALLLEMWEANGLYERECLRTVFLQARLRYGLWKAMKLIAKQAEEQDDTEVFGAIAARVDEESSNSSSHRDVSQGTLVYLRRRAWRYLKQLGQSYPHMYCRAAVDMLKSYSDRTTWSKTWVANHIFFHESGKYGGVSFSTSGLGNDRLRHRAFAEVWQKQFEPLLRLLENARSRVATAFAIESLKKDHAIALRDIDVTPVLRVLNRHTPEADEFCVWLFDSVPKFEQSRLRELGLHEAVLGLLDSESKKALHFVVTYARTHAKDLALDRVLELTNHDNKEVRKFAVSLLSERDPRKDVGLDAWAQLLGTDYGHKLAEEAIVKHFSAKELTPDWFKGCLLRDDSFDFASKHLFKVHKVASLGASFFLSLFNDPKLTRSCAAFVMENLRKLPAAEHDLDFLQKALVNNLTSHTVQQWVEDGYIDSKVFGVDFLMMLAFQPEWEASEWLKELAGTNAQSYEDQYPEDYSEYLSETVFGWLSDVRKFQPNEVGFERLMQLVERPEARYHDFAANYMVKAFMPGDFAESGEEAPAKAEGEINVDFEQQTFVFTGKMKTMTRSEAQAKVKEANGKKGSGVTANLDWLVIGDEGSPFYGAGKKGSKQLKAEALIEKGAPLKVISETAFLQMLSGTRKEADEDTVEAGCERLWEYVAKKGSEQNPLRLFAIKYIRNHHQDICPILTERPVDPGAEIPHDFLTFERLLPLFKDSRASLVEFALELAQWEAGNWKPDFNELVELLETAPTAVREFIAKAMTAGPEKAHDRYRLPEELITADNVYRLCGSADDFARGLGMRLLEANSQLADPASLFRLTESTDRRMRYFAVEAIWRAFRTKGISKKWQPPVKEGEEPKALAPKSDPQLAEANSMQLFLRMMLYEIPPGRFSQKKKKGKQVKILASCKAKLALVDTYCNIALDDQEFAALITPVLEEFMNSKGKGEERAAVVALTRIAQKYPELGSWKETVA